jgi:hypothetical protein
VSDRNVDLRNSSEVQQHGTRSDITNRPQERLDCGRSSALTQLSDQRHQQDAIGELNELAASVTLAGDEGARVRGSIAAKARAIRVRGLADAESAAQSANERMSLPIVLLMLGFVVFLGYPAVMQVLTGL